ncbi:Cytochrome P450 3A40 [Nymphon striatum]|nr:Cytochrome P450 3A40 [Nymphon striatum]
MVLFFTCLVFPVVIPYLLWWIFSRRARLQLFERLGIPGPQPQSLFYGNALEYLSHPIHALTKWRDEYGDMFGYFYGPRPFLVVSDPVVIKTVLKERFDNFTDRPDMPVPIEPLASGVVHAINPLWSTSRKPITCALTGSKIKLMNETVNGFVDEFLEVIDEQESKPFNIHQYCQGLTMDVICKCALAMKTNCIRNQKEPILLSVKDFMNEALNFAVRLAIALPLFSKVVVFLYNNFTAGKGSDVICNHLKKVLALRRGVGGPKRSDMLQLLLDTKKENGDGLSETELLGSCFSLVIAGYETTANHLAYTFYLLAKHPDIQKALAEEVDFMEERPTEEDLGKCQLLNRVVRESFRMYPPVVTFIARKARDAIHLGNYTIPKEMSVIIPVYQIHHDENLWPNPEKFDPDRFSLENSGNISPMSYLPFSDGRRNCLGERFALFESKLTIARTVKKFEFSVCPETEDSITITVPTVVANPKNGVIIKAIPRSQCL